MKQGLLWYDGNPNRTLVGKVTRAAHHYHQKCGSWPNTCYVNPADYDGLGTVTIGEHAIKILSAINCLRYHYWLGEAETQQDNEDER